MNLPTLSWHQGGAEIKLIVLDKGIGIEILTLLTRNSLPLCVVARQDELLSCWMLMTGRVIRDGDPLTSPRRLIACFVMKFSAKLTHRVRCLPRRRR
jgi:hypothetical protein